jgi:hypothetical protein
MSTDLTAAELRTRLTAYRAARAWDGVSPEGVAQAVLDAILPILAAEQVAAVEAEREACAQLAEFWSDPSVPRRIRERAGA